MRSFHFGLLLSFIRTHMRTNTPMHTLILAYTHTDAVHARARTHIDAHACVHTYSQTNRPSVGPYAFGASSSNFCPASHAPITTAAECAAAAATSVAAAAAGIATTTYGGVMPSISTSGTCSGQFSGAAYPMGCFYYSTGSCMAVGVWFNPDPVGAARSSGRLLCKLRGTAEPTNAGDTNAPTTAAPTAALTLSTTLIAWHGMRRCRFALAVALHCCTCMRTARGSTRLHLREDHFRLDLAGDVSSISMGTFVWRCGSSDCYTDWPSCALSIGLSSVALSGTLPDAIGRLSCRSKIDAMYAPQRWRSQRGPQGPCSALASTRLLQCDLAPVKRRDRTQVCLSA